MLRVNGENNPILRSTLSFLLVDENTVFMKSNSIWNIFHVEQKIQT